MDSRPIKFNKSGKYNLDFIDWNNEWERVGEIACKIENGEPVSDPEEEERVRKHMELDELKFGVKLENYPSFILFIFVSLSKNFILFSFSSIFFLQFSISSFISSLFKNLSHLNITEYIVIIFLIRLIALFLTILFSSCNLPLVSFNNCK